MAEEMICPKCKRPSYTAAPYKPSSCPYCGFIFCNDNREREKLEYIKEERKMKKSILAIDDDAAILSLIINILNEHGYEVKTARNGLEGLKMIESAQYDLIISDINMPIMNGIKFYRELINKTPSMKERIIFITGDMESKTEMFIQETGVRWLSKPINITEFLRAVNDLEKA
jgi:CheY-like chemotaxis protein